MKKIKEFITTICYSIAYQFIIANIIISSYFKYWKNNKFISVRKILLYTIASIVVSIAIIVFYLIAKITKYK